jgi:hypothetical protein
MDPPAAAKPQVVVDAPFVFRGTDPPPTSRQTAASTSAATTAAAPATNAAKAKKAKAGKTPPVPQPAQTVATKPGADPKPATFFGRVKNFFRSIFK